MKLFSATIPTTKIDIVDSSDISTDLRSQLKSGAVKNGCQQGNVSVVPNKNDALR